ncbi:MAG: hypothetical protein CMB99_13145 [Flavobacteriaceae bacterium]|nr:hypothetical protein [Flavobacteriaceae bacterium]|tara:strand:- start:3313 stop:3951 length:639 start_codon:yes stop_codon:yes gene_type:complete
MRGFFVFFLILLMGRTNGQSQNDYGFLPKVILSKKYGERLRWINSAESRTDLNKDATLNNNLLDLSSILSYRADVHHTLNFGYIIRFEGGEVIHRTFQHFNYLQEFSASQLSHRFAFEQFFEPNKSLFFRGRYRAMFQKPLNGERVDVKEFYIKLGNEYLWNFEDKELEIRFTPYLGYQLSTKDRIEFGIDYRTLSFDQNNFWFRTTWYISI